MNWDIWELGGGGDKVYYLNKIMNSVEWYWGISLPKHFWAEHPIGSVLGRAIYGDYFFIYQGCTVGGNRKLDELFYPIIGHHVLMYAGASVIGMSKIGDYVIIAANTHIVNQDIPSCCIVFGKSPDIIIKKKTKDEILERMNHIWREN